MKLTIKDPSHKISQLSYFTSSNSQQSFNWSSPCCVIEPYGARHVLNRPLTKQEQLLSNLVKIDCISTYSRVNPKLNMNGVCTTIMKAISKFKLRYQPWIGYLCTHCYNNYQNEHDRMNIISQFVNRFKSLYEDQRYGAITLGETVDRLKIYCSDALVIPSQATLASICSKHQQTLLLQFLPAQYSKYIIEKYIKEDGDLQEYVRLVTSLTHFVLNTTNPINQSHFADLMFRPYMGNVEWPIIIANRHTFEAGATQAPVFQHF